MVPEDVVFQILLRLPVASLLRFRSVCKLWLSIIDSSLFISQHLHRISDSDNNNLLVMHDLVDPSTTFRFSFISVDDLQLSKHAEFMQVALRWNGRTHGSYRWSRVFEPPQLHILPGNKKHAEFTGGDKLDYVGTLASSFHGIVCLIHSKTHVNVRKNFHSDVVSLWNPATKQSTVLPPLPPPQCDIFEYSVEYGFGFDVKTNDYKVVRYVNFRQHPMSHSNPLKSQGEVYCLSTDSWRVIETDVPLHFVVSSNPRRPFLKEIYCWLVFNLYKSRYSIISFNFSNELFGILSVPVSNTNGTPVLTFLREKIAFIDWGYDDLDPRSLYKIWVLDEYGAKESWTKLYTIALDQVDRPLGFSMDGKLILEKNKDRHKFCLYDPLTQEVSEVTTPGHVYEVAMYKESLISVKSASGVKKRNGL